MVEVLHTDEFVDWLNGLKNIRAKALVDARIARLANGNFGDVKRLGSISELRIDHGPGYRIYFDRRGEKLVILLAGGDKRTQARDIAFATRLAAEWKE